MEDGPGAVRRDFFLDGRVAAWQPVDGFRASTDAVFLAASIPARPGQAVLELGCGAAVAALCLAARVPGVRITGVEVQTGYAALARQNGDAAIEVVEADLTALPAGLRARNFDHVMANPPYFDANAPGAADPGRDRARRVDTPLDAWVNCGLRRLATGGWLTLIHRAERLAGILAALNGRAGAVRVLPLQPRAGRDARRVIVQARKGAGGPLRLLAPLVVHEGAAHDGDRESFTPEVQAILRGGGGLDLGAR